MSHNLVTISLLSAGPKYACIAGQLDLTWPPQVTEAVAYPQSVDVELVAFGVLHPDRVVVEPVSGQGAEDGGAQCGQPAGLGVDPLFARPDRDVPPATGVDVEVQAGLGRLGFRDRVEPDLRAVTVRVADPVRPVDQFLLRYAQVPVEVIPAVEAGRDRGQHVTQRRGPEPGQPVRVGAVDDQLEADRHRFLPGPCGWRRSSCQTGVTINRAPGRTDEHPVRLPPLLPDLQAGLGDGLQQSHRAHEGPGEGRAAPAVGMLEPRGQLLVDVARLRFDQELAARRQQLRAAV